MTESEFLLKLMLLGFVPSKYGYTLGKRFLIVISPIFDGPNTAVLIDRNVSIAMRGNFTRPYELLLRTLGVEDDKE